MTRKTTTIIVIALVVILILVGGGYWLYSSQGGVAGQSGGSKLFGFIPLNRGSGNSSQNTQNNSGSSTNQIATNTQQTINQNSPIPVLRLLSNTPVGGYGASTTGTTTVVRWVDRGRGNIFEVAENSNNIATLSNTLLPRVYESEWNKNLTAFIGPTLQDDSEVPVYIYAELKSRIASSTTPSITSKTASTTSVAAVTSTTPQSVTPFSLQGKNLPANTVGYALSPQKNKVFILAGDFTGTTGYVTNIDGSKATQIFTTPLSQLNVDWPSENVIAITNEGTADRAGYLYFVNPSTGSWTKILGPLKGLGTRVSSDGKNVLFSASGSSGELLTGIYNITKGTETDTSLRTLADKCVWGNFYKEIVYCAVPFQSVRGSYPDDWYTGTLSTVDKLWQINSLTGETKLVNPLIGQADRVIDALNLGLDDKDNYLFFMNKNDLSLWSVDLVKSH